MKGEDGLEYWEEILDLDPVDWAALKADADSGETAVCFN